MAKAKKLPSGSWRCQVYDYTDDDGKRHYKSFTCDDPSAKGKRKAEEMAAAWAVNKESRVRCSITYGEALDKYIEERSVTLSPSTIREYKRSRRVDFQMLMNIKLEDITQELVQKAVNEERRTHSPKSVRNMHGLLSGVMRAYRPDFALSTTLPQRERPELYIPSDDDVRAILEYVGAYDKEMELPILLAAFGPMRRSEICALESKDIKGNVVHVRQALVQDDKKEWVLKTTKSYAGDRYIDFPDFVAEKLHLRKGRITTITPTAMTSRFRKILRMAGVKHFRFHDLRHYSASIQHAIGIPDAYIMQRGGWGSDAVLKNVYRHVLQDKEREMTEKANRHFSGLMQHEMQHNNKKDG